MANPKNDPNLARPSAGGVLKPNLSDLVVKPDLGAQPSAPAPAPAAPAGPDPSRIYGYIALVDPTTGATHQPLNPDNPNEVRGAPSGLTMTFRAPDGGVREVGLPHLQSVRRAPDGTFEYMHPANAGVAWYYDVQLNADRTEGAPRPGGPAGLVATPLRTEVVSYNPDQWRFEGVAVAFVSIPDPNGDVQEGANRFFRIPLARRESPFPDLPDTV